MTSSLEIDPRRFFLRPQRWSRMSSPAGGYYLERPPLTVLVVPLYALDSTTQRDAQVLVITGKDSTRPGQPMTQAQIEEALELFRPGTLNFVPAGTLGIYATPVGLPPVIVVKPGDEPPEN